MDLDYIKKNFPKWNKKTTIPGNNRQYKFVGCGNSALKVLKFEPQPELNNKGGWSQVFWNYKDILGTTPAKSIVEKMEEQMRG